MKPPNLGAWLCAKTGAQAPFEAVMPTSVKTPHQSHWLYWAQCWWQLYFMTWGVTVTWQHRQQVCFIEGTFHSSCLNINIINIYILTADMLFYTEGTFQSSNHRKLTSTMLVLIHDTQTACPVSAASLIMSSRQLRLLIWRLPLLQLAECNPPLPSLLFQNKLRLMQ